MRRSLLCALILLGIAAGCQQQHAENKRAAMERWQRARLQVSLDMARQQFEGGQLDKARETAQGALKIDPQYAEALVLLGQIHLEQDQANQARRCFEKCLLSNPEHAEANYSLGSIYEKWNELDRAEAYYQAAWQAEPDQLAYLLATVETLISQGKLERGLEMISQGVERVGRDASLCLAAGTIHERQGNSEEAIAMFRQANHLRPGDSSIMESLAFALQRNGQAAEAAILFEELTEKAREESASPSAAHYLAMGDCYIELGELHKAQRCFENLNEHGKASATVWGRLAQIALARNQYDRARQCASNALALDSKRADALVVLGYLALKKQYYEQAENIFRGIIEEDDRNGLAYCLLGQSLAGRGKIEEAADCYAAALAIDPDDPVAQKLVAALKQTDIAGGNSETILSR